MIPRFLLKQITRPFGARMKPRTKKQRPHWTNPAWGYQGPVNPVSLWRGSSIPDDHDSDLEEDEYQYFIRVREGFGKCRVCLNVIGGDKAARKAHIHESRGELQCSVKLIATMKEARKKRECIICGRNATVDKWGFWFCGGHHVNTWRNLFPHEALLFNASMVQAEANGWVK